MPLSKPRIETTAVHDGHGRLEIDLVAGQSAVTSAQASSPLKILVPQSRGPSVWACTSSFGGGLVAGDQTRLDVRLGPAARGFIGTQASTKIYRNPARRPCSHSTRAVLGPNALLVFAPDPVQAFAGSSYTQRQEFHLADNAGLALVDWFTSGRAARGERWAFAHLHSRNDVFIPEERVFVDSIRLNPSDAALGPHQAGRFNCFAMLLLIGTPLREFAARLLADISSRPVERRAQFACSASPIRDGAVLRLAGESVEDVSRELHRHLKPLSVLLGDDPWERKF